MTVGTASTLCGAGCSVIKPSLLRSLMIAGRSMKRSYPPDLLLVIQRVYLARSNIERLISKSTV